MSLETLSEHKCHGGTQGFYRHESEETGTPMRFAVFVPPRSERARVPVLYYLSGLTCTEETATVKAGAQQHAARHGLMLVVPDTSPRETGLAGEEDDWEFGTGAGFYLDATREPWARHYRMYSYVTRELPALVGEHFPGDVATAGICGHSMGGHGALTIALKHPERYRSVSAFAPICAPTQCPWGQKAFSGYLGEDREAWASYDATELVRTGPIDRAILVDQGADDQFLATQLHPGKFLDACREAGQAVELRTQPGYDHGYYFIQTFIGDHLAFHASALAGA